MSNTLQVAIPTQRLRFLDIAKGLLIVIVVLGHSNPPFSNYIFWFHIPAFFAVSGMLHRQPLRTGLKAFSLKKSKGLLIPYFCFGTCIAIIIAIYSLPNLGAAGAAKSLVLQIGRLLYSGKALFGAFGAFWFIPVLVLTILGFTVIHYFLQSKKWSIAVLFVSYAIGFLMGHFKENSLPWNSSVVPVALFYYGMGYFSKDFILRIYKMQRKTLLFIVVFFVCALAIFLGDKGCFSLAIDMKIARYSNPVLAIVIPLVFTSATIFLAMLLEATIASKPLVYLGLNSLIIMYLHIPANHAVQALTHIEPHYSLFVLYGTIIPLLIGRLLENWAFTRQFFLGRKGQSVSIVKELA